MVKYPVGMASFREIRKGGFLYVDKTMYIHRLVESGKYFYRVMKANEERLKFAQITL